MDPQNLVLPPLYPPQGKPSLKYIRVLQQPGCNTLCPNCNQIPPICPTYRDKPPNPRGHHPLRRKQKLGEICQWIGVYGGEGWVTSPGSVCRKCPNLRRRAAPLRTRVNPVRKCAETARLHPPQGVPTDLYGRFRDDGRGCPITEPSVLLCNRYRSVMLGHPNFPFMSFP